jgi:hypothetical protein
MITPDSALTINPQTLMVRSLVTAALSFMLAAAMAADEGKISFDVLPLPPTLGLPDRHTNFVIRSAQQWEVWANNLSAVADPLPAIDFEHYTAIIASAGYKEHGPVVVTFESITDAGNVIRVKVSVTTPTTCPPQPVAGHFAAIALIPTTDKPIQVDVSSRDTSCANH